MCPLDFQADLCSFEFHQVSLKRNGGHSIEGKPHSIWPAANQSPVIAE